MTEFEINWLTIESILERSSHITVQEKDVVKRFINNHFTYQESTNLMYDYEAYRDSIEIKNVMDSRTNAARGFYCLVCGEFAGDDGETAVLHTITKHQMIKNE